MKDDNSLQNPHDKFFKTLFSDPEKVKSYLQGVLPDEVSQKLSFDTLKLDGTSYIDDQLNDFYSDVVYECLYEDEFPIQIAFLFEHKSYVPQYPHLQLLRYMLSIWELRVKKKRPLHPVIPLIIYHGSKEWKDQPFEGYFEGKFPKELLKFFPSFQYILTNLDSDPLEYIRKRFSLISLQIGFLVMKSIRDKDLKNMLEDILKDAESLFESEIERSFLGQIFVYLYYGSNLNAEEVMERAYNVSNRTGEIAKTAAMLLMEKGLEEGIKEGIRQGIEQGIERSRQMTIKKMLLKDFKPHQIAEILELPLEFVKKLEALLQEENKKE